jgi:hypothetical protein
MGRKRKKAREDAAEKALELICRWLHAHKMVLDEKVAPGGLNAGMSLWSPGGKTEFEDEDFPAWDWAGRPVPKEDAVLAVAEWLFGESGDEDGEGPSAVVEEVSCDVSPGRRRTETRAEPVPKFSFSSLEEFILKAEASGEFPVEARE